MKQKRHLYGRVISFFLIAALLFSFVPTLAAEAQGTTYEVGDYKGGKEQSEWTAPTEEGKVFAGWYSDADFTTSFTGTTGTAYAKFVDARVLTVKKQFNSDATASSAATNIRFLTSIDTSLDYQCAGFEVSAAGKNFNLKETTAYTSVLVDGQTMPETAGSVFGNADSAYFVVHTLTDIPNQVFDSNFTVKPYWVTADGTKVYGETNEFTIRDTLNNVDYDNGVDLSQYGVTKELYNNDYSEDVNKGVDAAWKKSAFHGSTAALDNEQARITSTEHVFVFGYHSYGQYGGVTLTKDRLCKASFDLKLGETNANKTFNLYVMTENGDPRFGDAQKTLTLDFSDIKNFVTMNTDNFAHVTYDAATRTAHIEAVFQTDAEKNTLMVSKSNGQNNWLLDNLVISEVATNYDNGVDLSQYGVTNELYNNDYSTDVNKDVDETWQQSAFYGSTAALEDGQARITSDEHVFVFGMHTYGQYGGVSLTQNQLCMASFDLKLGAEDANKTFNLYIETENGDPRYGDVVKTLTLDFSDIKNFVKENTGNFAHVTYNVAEKTAHVEAVFRTDATKNTLLVSRSAGTNNWLLDNLAISEVAMNYDNGVNVSQYRVTKELYNNDYSEDVDKGVDAEWKKSAFYDSTAALENGQARITSSEHVFVFGYHTYGQYGGVSLTKDQLCMASFDLKLGAEDANETFNLYIATENGDPRFGDVVKTLTLKFDNLHANVDNFVTTNTDDFAHVSYNAATQIVHIDALFQTDATNNTLMVSRSAGTNNWLLDNMVINEVAIKYDNGVDVSHLLTAKELYNNDYSENVDKGVDAGWKKSAFNGSTAALENGQARITSEEHVFVFGYHTYGQYGGVSLTKDQLCMASFDLKLGAEEANKTFNLYIATENGDPRFGDVQKTLTLDFSDINNFVTVNTDNFAHVSYDGANQTAHIDAVFQTDAGKNTLMVSKSNGQNNWLLDNMVIKEMNYDNGVDASKYETVKMLYGNDYSEDVNKGVDDAWDKIAFNGSEAALDNGQARITSPEHVFVFGEHVWGQYGGVSLTKDQLCMASFDLKLGAADANKFFTLYVTTENGDPRFGDVQKTLTLDFSDINNFVTVNTDNFAHVSYDGANQTAHIDAIFKTDANKNTLLVSRSNGVNNWLMDNMKIRAISSTGQISLNLSSFGYGDVKLSAGLFKTTYDNCMAYYDSITADDILYLWRKDAGLDTKSGRDLGWDEAGKLTSCCQSQLISAKARKYAITQSAGDLAVVQSILDGYEEITQQYNMNGNYYPRIVNAYYFEKQLRALLDIYEYCHLDKAYEIAKRFVEWGLTDGGYNNPTKLLGDKKTEWYTMSESLDLFADLAEEKGESVADVEKYRKFARLYDYTDFWNIFYNNENVFNYSPTAQDGVPYLDYFHAYSHLNSVNSALEAYKQTGDQYYFTAAQNFFNWAKTTQKFATGGYGAQWEYLLPRQNQINWMRESEERSCETQCTSYAVVGMNDRMLSYTGDAAYGQWTEEVFYNMTIASLETSGNGYAMYYSKYSPLGGNKYLREDWPWACCAGTRPLVVMEYLKSIYFHDDMNLYVNLYTNSSVDFVNEKGNKITLQQNSTFPESSEVVFTVKADKADTYNLCFRKPEWLSAAATITVNGSNVAYTEQNGWMVVNRTWNNGDTVKLNLPMNLYYSKIQSETDSSDCLYALKYGPVVLACEGKSISGLSTTVPVTSNPNTLFTQSGLTFTAKSNSKVKFKPYYVYGKMEYYTLYLSSK